MGGRGLGNPRRVRILKIRRNIGRSLTSLPVKVPNLMSLPLTHSSYHFRFAIDWLHEKNLLKVLYGEDGHVICTLSIGRDYPNQGSVTLAKVEGIQDGPDPKTIRPSQDAVRLSAWLNFLHDYFKDT